MLQIGGDGYAFLRFTRFTAQLDGKEPDTA